MLFKIVNEGENQFYVVDKALRDPTIDKWSNPPGMELGLNMTGSGRSGSILLKNDTVPEFFSVTAGIHNSLDPWCDILPNLPAGASADGINRSYYQSRLEQKRTVCKRTSQGTSISLAISELRYGTFIAKVTIRRETSAAAGPIGQQVCFTRFIPILIDFM